MCTNVSQSKNNVLLSIIIPCHNEENYITRLLLALSNQTNSSFEVIIVDNGCTDKTMERVWNYAFKSKLNIVIVHEDELGVSRARNSGAANASSSLMLFLDADNLVPTNFVELLLNVAGNGAAGTIRTLAEENDYLGKAVFWLLEGIKIFLRRPFGKSFVPRVVFQRVGGFDEKIALGENVDFLRRVKRDCHKYGVKFVHFPIAISCSLRRFQRLGYFRILSRWLIAYLGIYSSFYETMAVVNNRGGRSN